jgi:spore maturation protein CgeB
MRILVVGPRFEDSFADNVTSALEEMGHDVHSAEFAPHARYFSLPRQVLRLVARRVAGERPRRDERALLAKARSLRPAILLALTWDIHPEILDQLSLRGSCKRVLWWGDAPANSHGWGLANPHWDTVYVKDPVAVEKLRLIGTDAHLMHEAMNPRWHRRVQVRPSNDVVVFGNYYGFRQAVALRLLDCHVPLALYGNKPPTWAHPRIAAAWRGRYVARDEKSHAVGEGLACLNTFAFAEGQSMNCRAFEIAGAGGLQLIEDRPIVSECFEPGTEILPFRTFDELIELIERARRSPEEMQLIRERAWKRAHAEHTYRHRLQKLLRDFAS